MPDFTRLPTFAATFASCLLIVPLTFHATRSFAAVLLLMIALGFCNRPMIPLTDTTAPTRHAAAVRGQLRPHPDGLDGPTGGNADNPVPRENSVRVYASGLARLAFDGFLSYGSASPNPD